MKTLIAIFSLFFFSPLFSYRAFATVTLECTNNPATDAGVMNTAIGSLPATGGALYIPGGMTCNLGVNTVNINVGSGGARPITIFGDGDSSVIKGTGSPILTTGLQQPHGVTLENFKLQMMSLNDGLVLDKIGDGRKDVRIFHVNFEKPYDGNICNGTLLKLLGVSFGEISSNFFNTKGCTRSFDFQWAGSVTGVLMDASTAQYTQNNEFMYNTFEYMNLAVKSTAGWGPANAGHLFHNNNIWDVNYAMDFNSSLDASDDIGIVNNNIDGCWLGCISADNYSGLRVKGNFIAVGSSPNITAGPAIRLKATRDFSGNNEIRGNHIIRWNDKPGAGGDAIEFFANSAAILVSDISQNFIYGNGNARYGIYLHGEASNVAWMNLVDNDFSFWDTGIKLDNHVFHTKIDGASGAAVATIISDAGGNNLHLNWRNQNGLSNEQWGKATFSGGSNESIFTFAHGMAAIPTSVNITPGSSAAADKLWATVDATNIVVHFKQAPPNGSNNIELYWRAIAN